MVAVVCHTRGGTNRNIMPMASSNKQTSLAVNGRVILPSALPYCGVLITGKHQMLVRGKGMQVGLTSPPLVCSH